MRDCVKPSPDCASSGPSFAGAGRGAFAIRALCFLDIAKIASTPLGCATLSLLPPAISSRCSAARPLGRPRRGPTAGEAADYRVLRTEHTFSHELMGRRFCAAVARTRVDRGPHRRCRISLGGGPQRAPHRDRGRVCSAQGRCHFTYATPPVIAARQATAVIPIVSAVMGDPVGGQCQ
jgi:hypothetical protein